MLFKPGILALFLSSLLILGMVLYASFYGALILRYWNLKSGSETQLKLERRTYLISTLMGYALVFQLLQNTDLKRVSASPISELSRRWRSAPRLWRWPAPTV